MRIINLMTGAFTALLLAGCGSTDGREEAVEAGAQGNQATNYQAEMAALPEGQRNAGFIRAIRDARLDCQHVESSQAAGEYRGNPVWNVRCAGGGNWTLVVTADGTAQILDANEARLVGADAGNQAGDAAANAQ
jgi:hypothetical protein